MLRSPPPSKQRRHLSLGCLMRRIRLNRRAIYSVVIVAALLILTASYAWYRARAVPEVHNVPISELINRAERGEIPHAIISGTVVSAVDKSGAMYRSLKEEQQP